MVKADQMTPDWVTWNGYAGQYVKHPLEAHPGHTLRFYVVDAGPSLNTTFHVVGTSSSGPGSTATSSILPGTACRRSPSRSSAAGSST